MLVEVEIDDSGKFFESFDVDKFFQKTSLVNQVSDLPRKVIPVTKFVKIFIMKKATYNVITSGQIQNDNINLMITIIKQK